MNVFDNNSDTRATVVITHCYENHAQDARVRPIDTNPTLGSNNGDCLRGGQSLVLVRYDACKSIR